MTASPYCFSGRFDRYSANPQTRANGAMVEVGTQTLFRLLDDVSRIRPLDDAETTLLVSIINRQRTKRINFKWDEKHEALLLKAAQERAGITAFASEIGITPMACYNRLKVIRQREQV